MVPFVFLLGKLRNYSYKSLNILTCVYLWEEGYVIYSCTSDDKVVRVPKEIKGKPVIAIGERGLANLKYCEAIVLPDTVRYLAKRCVYD